MNLSIRLAARGPRSCGYFFKACSAVWVRNSLGGLTQMASYMSPDENVDGLHDPERDNAEGAARIIGRLGQALLPRFQVIVMEPESGHHGPGDDREQEQDPEEDTSCAAVAAGQEGNPEDERDGRRQRHPGMPGFGFFLGLWLTGYRMPRTRFLWCGWR